MQRRFKSYPPGCDLATMASHGETLECGCWKCGRYQLVDPAGLIPKLGASFHVANVYLVIKCSNCGATGEAGVWARPRLPNPIAEHARRMGVEPPPEPDRTYAGRPAPR